MASLRPTPTEFRPAMPKALYYARALILSWASTRVKISTIIRCTIGTRFHIDIQRGHGIAHYLRLESQGAVDFQGNSHSTQSVWALVHRDGCCTVCDGLITMAVDWMLKCTWAHRRGFRAARS
jgi:hypothetical protein